MSGFLPLRPGLWWMRRLHLPGKLVSLGAVMVAALAAAVLGAPWWVVVLCALAVAYPLLVLHLSLLNQAPASAYFAQTLQTWEQGRFIRFHGIVQWLGWLWPFVAMLYVVLRFSRREQGPGAAS